MGLGPFRPGDQCRGYAIVRELGEGGYSCVYEATREFSTVVKGVIQPRERAYALKCLKRCYVDIESARDRLHQEAFLLVGLQHENIVRFVDTGFSETGFDFVVMELAEGKTLAERLASWHFSVTDALKVAMQVADGLAWAHAKGVLHLDLKPRNVMVTDGLGVKVLDLGAAKYEFGWHLSNSTPATAAQITVGYAAPEQLDGASEVDHRADIFALGEITYEMLTGQHPFRGKAQQREQCAARQFKCQAKPLSGFGVPEDVAAIVHRALARNPEDRHSSMAELREALRGAYYKRAEDVVEQSPKPALRIKGAQGRPNAVEGSRGPTARVADPLAVFKNPTRPDLGAAGVEMVQRPIAPAMESGMFDEHQVRRESKSYGAASIRIDTRLAQPAEGSVGASSTRTRKLSWIMSLAAALCLALPLAWWLQDHWEAGAVGRWSANAAGPTISRLAPTPPIPEENRVSPSAAPANLEVTALSAPIRRKASDPAGEGSVPKEGAATSNGRANTLKRVARPQKPPAYPVADQRNSIEPLDNPFRSAEPGTTRESVGELGVVPLASDYFSTYELPAAEPPMTSKRRGPKLKAPKPSPEAIHVPDWDTIGAEMGTTPWGSNLNGRVGQ